MAAKRTTKTAAPDHNRFEELRQRAIDSGRLANIKTTDTPFILDEEWGFKENPITVTKPAFTTAELISEALRVGQVLQALRLVFGENTGRVANMLDGLGDEAGAAAILLIEDIMVHFYGPGAAQVFPR